MAAARVLVVVAHPVIASGIETLLRLEGDYEVKRVASLGEATKLREWSPQVALVDGTLLANLTEANLGAPAYVLSGNERDGRQLARKLDDSRGWLRKDATGQELAQAINTAITGGSIGTSTFGTFAISIIVLLSIIVLALVVYLIWLAVS